MAQLHAARARPVVPAQQCSTNARRRRVHGSSFCLRRRALPACYSAVFVVGTAPPGTSTRGTSQPTAASLSTLGAYSIVRHPLYLANTLVALGCSLLSGTWYLPLIVVLLSFIYHERIAAHEEAFLLSTFGDGFRTWAREVPAMIPAFGGYRPRTCRFRFRRGDRTGIPRFVCDRHGIPGVGHNQRFRQLRSVSRWTPLWLESILRDARSVPDRGDRKEDVRAEL